MGLKKHLKEHLFVKWSNIFPVLFNSQINPRPCRGIKMFHWSDQKFLFPSLSLLQGGSKVTTAEKIRLFTLFTNVSGPSINPWLIQRPNKRWQGESTSVFHRNGRGECSQLVTSVTGLVSEKWNKQNSISSLPGLGNCFMVLYHRNWLSLYCSFCFSAQLTSCDGNASHSCISLAHFPIFNSLSNAVTQQGQPWVVVRSERIKIMIVL